jgi:hypothetical protein
MSMNYVVDLAEYGVMYQIETKLFHHFQLS